MNFTTPYRGAAVQYRTQAHCLMPGPVSRWCADGWDAVTLGKHFPTFRFMFMDVFSGLLGREGKGKSFLRNVLKIPHQDARRHLPEGLNPHAVTALKLRIKQCAADTGGTERANWTVHDLPSGRSQCSIFRCTDRTSAVHSGTT
jgi:hypothetical protein